MISKWRTVSRTLERWLATITRYIRDRRQIRLTQLSIDFYRGDSIRRRRIRIQPESSQAALWTRVGQLFFFITEASHAYDRYCGAYVLDRNELNIERTYVIGSRERERKKKKRRSNGTKFKIRFEESYVDYYDNLI